MSARLQEACHPERSKGSQLTNNSCVQFGSSFLLETEHCQLTTTHAHRKTICVISGGAPSRTGAPTVPIPRFTYSADNPFGAFGISLIVSPMRFGSIGIESGR